MIFKFFFSRLNNQQSANIPAGWEYVLPTESQWEYACRAGTSTMYSWGNDINSTLANYLFSGLGQTIEVGQYTLKLGAFSICMEMSRSGLDWYGTILPATPLIDPTGEASGSNRVGRGGSWLLAGGTCVLLALIRIYPEYPPQLP